MRYFIRDMGLEGLVTTNARTTISRNDPKRGLTTRRSFFKISNRILVSSDYFDCFQNTFYYTLGAMLTDVIVLNLFIDPD